MPVKYVSGDNDGRAASKVKILTSDTETVSYCRPFYRVFRFIIYSTLFTISGRKTNQEIHMHTHTYTHTPNISQ